jgi:anti-sigma-K factor RskA
METQLHDLTPAYALDALHDDELRAYEEHLRRCARCQGELAALSEPVAALAYAVESPAPPPALRDRILERARAERPNVVPLRPRVLGVTRAAAALAAAAAVGFAIWGVSLQRKLDRTEQSAQQPLNIFAESGTRQVPVSGDHGTLYVAPTGQAALVVATLEPAPKGKTYEAWVIRAGNPSRAGTFSGRGGPALVPLELPVPNGSIVAVTLERAGGVAAPTGPRVLSAQA